MKKLFMILAISAMFVACSNNETETTEEIVIDSTEVTDSIPVATPDSVCDTVAVVKE